MKRTPKHAPPAVIANIHRFGQILQALGTLGNAASGAASTIEFSGAAQTGNEQIDTKGDVKIVAGVPAVAVSGTLSVNGPRGYQTVLAEPNAGVGKYVSVGSSWVADPDGHQHLQGGNISVGVSTPTLPVSVAASPGTLSRMIDAVQTYFGFAPKPNWQVTITPPDL